jgi:F420-dependent oxidoreductase-like protein
MELRIFTEPQQGATYEDLLAVALAAEAASFGAFFRSDHYLKMGAVSGAPGPSDAWITLAGLARETSTIRLGTLLTAATFRLPGVLAIEVAGVDQMSQGRVELGLGAGWYAAEHESYGIPFPEVRERFERLEEQLEIITGLWDSPAGSSYEFHGRHYELSGGPGLPKPHQQPRPPIIVGGHGPKKTPRLAARFADEINVPFGSVEACQQQFRRVAEACQAIGRDPDGIVCSSALVLCCGVDEAEVERRAARIGRQVDELRTNGLCGTPEELVERLAAFRAAGATRVYLQLLDLTDLDQVALVGEAVLPRVADL